MIYNSPETIPAKIYFKILDGAPLSLLSTDSNANVQALGLAWKKIEDEYVSKKDSAKNKKILDLSKKMEILNAKMEATLLAVYHLKHVKDDDLLKLLVGYGHTFKWKREETYESKEASESIFQMDLDRIERSADDLKNMIEVHQSRMPKTEAKEGVEMTFDENVLSYAAFTGLGYVDPNILPLTQYDALINTGNNKMKALEKSASDSKNKIRKRRSK